MKLFRQVTQWAAWPVAVLAMTALAQPEQWLQYHMSREGRIAEKSGKNRCTSSLMSLPYLILGDAQGRGVAEGFPLDELEMKPQEMNK